MMKKITNLFEVNANDTMGTALLKGVTKGYLQGTLAAGLGLGVLAVGYMIVSNREESDEETEEEFQERVNMEVEAELEAAKANIYQS